VNASLERRKIAAARLSLLITIVMTIAKAAIGVATGSLAILADAIQSGLDLVSTTITLLAVRFSARPPDADHQFGHGKFENLSALIASGVLLVTAGWIVWEALQRLVFESVAVRPDIWAFGVILVSMVVDFTRSRALRRVARETGSQALEADALNFETDIFSSVAVFIGLSLVFIGEWLGIPWLEQADAVAAIVVAGLIGYLSIRLMRATVDVLTDRVDVPVADRIRQATLNVPGVLSVVRVRARRGGSTTFVDVVVTADRLADFIDSHALTEQVERAIHQEIERADVVVHVEPEAMPDESVQAQVHHLARMHGGRAHDVEVRDLADGSEVDFHLEVPRDRTLRDARRQADHLKADLLHANPRLRAVNIHIEAPHEGKRIQRLVTRDQGELARRVTNVAESVAGAGAVRSLRLYQSTEGAGVDAILTIAQPGDRSVEDAHECTEQVERALRRAVSSLRGILIEAAPADAPAASGSGSDTATVQQ
jgi:cation diffusion facilitator family transporter